MEIDANSIINILTRHKNETLTEHTINKIMEEIWGVQ